MQGTASYFLGGVKRPLPWPDLSPLTWTLTTPWGIRSRILMMQDPRHPVRLAVLLAHAQECRSLPTEQLEVAVLSPQFVYLRPGFLGLPQLLNNLNSLFLNVLVGIAPLT